MAANFSILSISEKSPIDFHDILKIIDDVCSSISFTRCEVIDNWQFENETEVAFSPENLYNTVVAGKILNVYGILDKKYNVGVQQYQENGLFVTDFWINTNNIPCLDTTTVTTENAGIINNICKILRELIKKGTIYCSAIGSELLVEASTNILEMQKKGHNVIMWVDGKEDNGTANEHIETIPLC